MCVLTLPLSHLLCKKVKKIYKSVQKVCKSVQKIVVRACNTGARWEGVPACRFITGSSQILMFLAFIFFSKFLHVKN